MRAEDLLAAVFPDAIACQDNMTGERERRIPDHPLVQETLRDCLTEAMDVDGLTDVLRRNRGRAPFVVLPSIHRLRLRSRTKS